jgi:hypothetical protein
MAISTWLKSKINQIEMTKLNVVDTLVRIIEPRDSEILRQTALFQFIPRRGIA